MGTCTICKTLRDYCIRAGITLHYHMLDRTSYQFCAGGYVVNGHLGSCMKSSSLLYRMQKELVYLLKYGSADPVYYADGSSIVSHKEPHAILPLAEPLREYNGFEVHTCSSPEYEKIAGLLRFSEPITSNNLKTMNKTCRNCIHRERWECGSKIISYCNKLKSNRTQNGMKKVKCTQIACDYYEEE